MIQFSKELYDTGNYEVVHRNGERPEFISFFSNGVIATLGKSGAGFFHNANGTVRNFSGQTNYDLFLIPKARWIYLFKGGNLGISYTYTSPRIYSSKEEAESTGKEMQGENYLETVKLISE
jgi:hypothetical protein